eukprot:CAMPEP_0194250998 /NCGR_PEP_ID=MMETSP0158-20130606/24354_1 /TAXON_ID=33649 /ORGANISM="Thalassionema nitzschioides, Strain L26-B" /LENGTH=96 /DNA_ID=CAMNT_0038987983 /DNA_START=172 /DNA_END=462 /DNA_ORIENTATION=+
MDDSIFSPPSQLLSPSTPNRKKFQDTREQDTTYSPTSTAIMMYPSSEYGMKGVRSPSSFYTIEPEIISVRKANTGQHVQEAEEDEQLLGLNFLPDD